jgi:toxin secretion/phage lysis holin
MDDILQFISQFHFRNELWVLFIPLGLMAIDILTGIVKAWAKNDFKSAIMRAGLAKKAGEIMILVVGELISYGLMLPDAIMNGISFYIIFMEFMSILENADELGIPIPKFVKDVINNVDDKLQHGDKNDEDLKL